MRASGIITQSHDTIKEMENEAALEIVAMAAKSFLDAVDEHEATGGVLYDDGYAVTRERLRFALSQATFALPAREDEEL